MFISNIGENDENPRNKMEALEKLTWGLERWLSGKEH